MTSIDPKVSSLSKNPLFEDIPKEKLSEIAEEAGYQVVSAHTVIFKEGDPGDNFYMINSGKVRVSKTGRGGVEIRVAELGAGDFFGHLAILTDGLREVKVEALDETNLTILTKYQFDEILRECPNASFAFAKQMSQYLARNITVIKKKTEHSFRINSSSWLDYFVIFSLSLLCGVIFNHSNPNGISLAPNFLSDTEIFMAMPVQAKAKHAEGKVLFVDARPSSLYDQMHIEGAVNIPLALFDIMYMMELSELDKKKNIIVYGQTISSHYDEKMARKLELRGHKNVVVLKGGLSAWEKLGYPVKS